MPGQTGLKRIEHQVDVGLKDAAKMTDTECLALQRPKTPGQYEPVVAGQTGQEAVELP